MGHMDRGMRKRPTRGVPVTVDGGVAEYTESQEGTWIAARFSSHIQGIASRNKINA